MGAKTYFGDEQTVHIPSRQLTGPREDKLAQLDAFLAQLHLVRLALCGQAVRLGGLPGADDAAATPARPGSARGLLRRVQRIFNNKSEQQKRH